MTIPWEKRAEFREAAGFLVRVDRAGGKMLAPVRDLAGEILYCLNQVSGELDRLCGISCPACPDNCCERATIWYDFRDLLYLYFGRGMLPEGQITKTVGRSGYQCFNLEPSGCSLSRNLRPFVCTWYFCPEQKTISTQSHLHKTILKIKEMRIRMEDEFCRITAGRGPGRL